MSIPAPDATRPFKSPTSLRWYVIADIREGEEGAEHGTIAMSHRQDSKLSGRLRVPPSLSLEVGGVFWRHGSPSISFGSSARRLLCAGE